VSITWHTQSGYGSKQWQHKAVISAQSGTTVN